MNNLQAVGMEINQPYINIIREEAALYFNGSKTVDEKIEEIMGNRINIIHPRTAIGFTKQWLQQPLEPLRS